MRRCDGGGAVVLPALGRRLYTSLRGFRCVHLRSLFNFTHMLYLRLVSDALQCADEHHDVRT
eukprot:7519425-Lingulodinium_polyedra.AAC.1